MKLLLIVFFLFISTSLFADENNNGYIINKNDTDSNKVESRLVQLPDENLPVFPGGEEALIKFISKEIVYPKKARRKSVSGRVIVQFIVEKDGSTSNHVVLSGIGYGCDEEAIRVVKLLPKFKPGMLTGYPIRVQFTVPINFKLINQ